uniref:Zinc finger, CCHC-type n=1 Tax=Tanacetum cinerariifolium TaxID=118510 RepID=A0A699H0I6_TANCI|nr:zinc finger, CCHC-type [Tanacetum cinerariifolium]
MGDKNPICTLGDYYKPSHEGYMNTIELPIENNMVPLRSKTIRLVQNGCSFHGLWSEDPNQHLKDFLKLVDPLNLDGKSRDRTTVKLRNDILMFQQHHRESLSEAWTCFKDLLKKVPHHGLDLRLQIQIYYGHVDGTTQKGIDYVAMSKRARSTRGQASSSRKETMEEKVRKFGLFDNGNHQMNYNNFAGHSIHSRDVFDLEFLSNKGLAQPFFDFINTDTLSGPQ